jgi:hypothetical protein
MLISSVREDVIVVLPVQSSEAVASSTGNEVGLHPRSTLSGHKVKTGGSKSCVQVKVWVQVAEFPHMSVVE